MVAADSVEVASAEEALEEADSAAVVAATEAVVAATEVVVAATEAAAAAATVVGGDKRDQPRKTVPTRSNTRTTSTTSQPEML